MILSATRELSIRELALLDAGTDGAYAERRGCRVQVLDEQGRVATIELKRAPALARNSTVRVLSATNTPSRC